MTNIVSPHEKLFAEGIASDVNDFTLDLVKRLPQFIIFLRTKFLNILQHYINIKPIDIKNYFCRPLGELCSVTSFYLC